MMARATAEQVKQVYDVMRNLNVNIYDLELWGHVSTSEDELRVTPEEAYDALADSGFDLVGDTHAIEHYYQATADHVTNALHEQGLMKPDHDFEEFDEDDDLLNHLEDEHDWGGDTGADLRAIHRRMHA